MPRLDVSINEPEFLPIETEILCSLLDKHEQYEAQGRDLEAKGMARAVQIVWEKLKGSFDDTMPTEWADL